MIPVYFSLSIGKSKFTIDQILSLSPDLSPICISKTNITQHEILH